MCYRYSLTQPLGGRCQTKGGVSPFRIALIFRHANANFGAFSQWLALPPGNTKQGTLPATTAASSSSHSPRCPCRAL